MWVECHDVHHDFLRNQPRCEVGNASRPWAEVRQQEIRMTRNIYKGKGRQMKRGKSGTGDVRRGQGRLGGRERNERQRLESTWRASAVGGRQAQITAQTLTANQKNACMSVHILGGKRACLGG